MKKVSLKKVYNQEELVDELLSAGDILKDPALNSCRKKECPGCEACYPIDEISRELSYYLHYFNRYEFLKADNYFFVAELIKVMDDDEFKSLTWWISRVKKLEFWELIKRSSWDSSARKELEFWEEDISFLSNGKEEEFGPVSYKIEWL